MKSCRFQIVSVAWFLNFLYGIVVGKLEKAIWRENLLHRLNSFPLAWHEIFTPTSHYHCDGLYNTFASCDDNIPNTIH